ACTSTLNANQTRPARSLLPTVPGHQNEKGILGTRMPFVLKLIYRPERIAGLLRSSRNRRLRRRARNTLRRFLRLSGSRRSRLANVDAAFEERAIFYRNPRRHHVAGQRTVTADVHPVARRQISTHLAQHHDLPRADIGGNHSITADGYAITREINRSLHPAVNI